MMTVGTHQPIVKSIAWTDEGATQAFAHALARQPALCDAVIALHGNLGAGKTTLVRHLLQALGIPGRIKSPTYAVVEPYSLVATDTGATQHIWHFDFYRFNDPREWEEAGFRDIFASLGLKLVEWPDKAGHHLPQADLHIAIDVRADESRIATLTALTTLGRELMA